MFKASFCNAYLAHKHHLLPGSRGTDVLQVTRDIVALHATDPVTPYLSLWARVHDFRREELEAALYTRRALVKTLCMRVTLHVTPSDELPSFFQATSAHRTRPEVERFKAVLAESGLCGQDDVKTFLDDLQRRVLAVLSEKGTATARQINQAVPALTAKIRHSEGKAYAGEFSVGSYLISNIMAAESTIVRTQPQGTWRSTLYAYAPLAGWLPDVDLNSVTPKEARVWLVRRYLAAFGPAIPDDVQWWTGFTKGETEAALDALASTLTKVTIEGIDADFLMLAEDVQRLNTFTPPDTPTVFLLPNLDPYIMGYRDRRRFLAPGHYAKVFDRAGNAVPTAWTDGRVVGVWGQRKDSSVACRLFEAVGEPAQVALGDEARRTEAFLDGESIPPRFRTAFSRTIEG